MVLKIFELYQLFPELAADSSFSEFDPNKTKNGLAIELKAGYNKPTETQKKWLKELNNANWVAVWSNNLDECLEIIDNYFNNK